MSKSTHTKLRRNRPQHGVCVGQLSAFCASPRSSYRGKSYSLSPVRHGTFLVSSMALGTAARLVAFEDHDPSTAPALLCVRAVELPLLLWTVDTKQLRNNRHLYLASAVHLMLCEFVDSKSRLLTLLRSYLGVVWPLSCFSKPT